MIRTFHPVGHGAFYTERFYDDNDDNIANVVFDCGTLSTATQLNNEIKKLQKSGMKEIDAIFISHFHTDHISRIDDLLSKFGVRKVFMPVLTNERLVEALFFNYIHQGRAYCRANRLLERLYDDNLGETQIKCIKDAFVENENTLLKGVVSWRYIPFCIDDSRTKLENKLKLDPYFGCIFRDDRIDIKRLINVFRSVGIEQCKELYEEVYGQKHNSYSMTVLSVISDCKKDYLFKPYVLKNDYKFCPLNCLYTGDFEASDFYPCKNDNFVRLREFYSEYWDSIGILQVPHHGSEHNLNCGLYTPPKLCIISAGIKDRYGHPDQQTLKAIHNMGCRYRKVTQDPNTKQVFEIII